MFARSFAPLVTVFTRPSSRPSRGPERLGFWAVLAALLAGACQTTPTWDSPNVTESLVPGGHGTLAALQPGDLVVAPVRNQTKRDDLPLGQLREEFYSGLIGRLYSPLELGYVEAHWNEDRFQGSPAADALLLVSIHEWDDRQLFTTGLFRAACEIYLFPGGSTARDPLWGATIRRELSLGRGADRPPAGTAAEIRALAVERFVDEALQALPERDVEAAHR